MTQPDPMSRNDPPSQQGPVSMASVRSQQCSAHSRTGLRCKRLAVAGANVCNFHGGAAPQVKKKAQLRLLALVDPAIATLAREMATADKSADRQRAANSILDRAGLARVTEVKGGDAREMLVAKLAQLRAEAGLPPVPIPEPEVTDADDPELDAPVLNPIPLDVADLDPLDPDTATDPDDDPHDYIQGETE